MLRTFSLAVVLFTFAGAAIADCGADHSARQVMTPDQQANASRVPATVKPDQSAASKSADAKHVKKPLDKASGDKLAATKVKD